MINKNVTNIVGSFLVFLSGLLILFYSINIKCACPKYVVPPIDNNGYQYYTITGVIKGNCTDKVFDNVSYYEIICANGNKGMLIGNFMR